MSSWGETNLAQPSAFSSYTLEYHIYHQYGGKGGEAPVSFRNLNVELMWEAYRVQIQEVFCKLPENAGITGGFHRNTGQFSQLLKYRQNCHFTGNTGITGGHAMPVSTENKKKTAKTNNQTSQIGEI